MYEVLAGVKQGDPLSSLLFNISLDSLINELDAMKDGFEIGDDNLSVLAFADNLALMSKDWEAMTQLLEVVEVFCLLPSLKVLPK